MPTPLFVQVYVGSGYWVSQESWGTLFRATTDSMLCRLACTMFWMPDELNDWSITRTLSNKFKSQGQTGPKEAPETFVSKRPFPHLHAVCSEQGKKRNQGCSVAPRPKTGKLPAKVTSLNK
ncbi:uncharacterized protein LOC142796476 [Rhipicephalus microplus]|uniref:uncharacterized protein LOC142796476 n=1 Tax=Rhipicephalus microplus TaxID=6941 RepID=UPI003F6B6C00